MAVKRGSNRDPVAAEAGVRIGVPTSANRTAASWGGGRRPFDPRLYERSMVCFLPFACHRTSSNVSQIVKVGKEMPVDAVISSKMMSRSFDKSHLTPCSGSLGSISRK